MSNKSKIICLVILILPLAVLLPYMGDFIYQPGAAFSDTVISHLPNALLIKQSLQSGNGIPLWSPAILSGYPFAADPLSGLWYPPGWVNLILPLPFGFNFSILLHILWGGIGMLLWLRAQGIKTSACLTGGIIFEAFPKLFAHFSAGHITLVYAVCWTPWLLLAEYKWAHSGKRRFWSAPGLILGFIGLADIRWTVFAGLLWLGYTIFEIKASFKYIILQIGLGLLVSAPVLLPLLQFTQLSTRASLTAQERFTLSLPPIKLLGFLFPDIGGYAEWIIYPGALSLALLLTVLSCMELRRRSRFWLWTGAIACLFSLGSSIPFLSTISFIPGFNLLRVPPRAMFIVGIVFCFVSALCLDAFLERNIVVEFSKKVKPDLILSGFATFIVLLAAGVWIITGSLNQNFFFGAVGIVIAAVIILLRLHQKISINLFAISAIAFLITNLVMINFLSIEPRIPGKVLSEGETIAAYLSKQPGLFRIYSPSYSNPQQTAALYGLQLADGVDPLQLSTYVKFMEQATGVLDEAYSVTLPPFLSGDTNTDNQYATPDARLLGILNVKYVVSKYDINVTGLSLVATIADNRIYENQFALPRAWLQPVASQIGDDIQNVDILNYQPNRIDISTASPGLLILSEVVYPGWQASIDGKKVPIMVAAGLLRSVEVPEGQHIVEFDFIPWVVYIGLTISILTLSFIVTVSIIQRKKSLGINTL